MYRRAVRFACALCAVAMFAACGGKSETKPAGNGAASTRIGGAQDSAIAFLRAIDRPARTIYDPPVDLTLRAPAATPGAVVAQTAKVAAKTPSESDTTRAKH